MLCSVCKKNLAVVFINKLDKDGKPTGETTGLCVNCAKKQGIDPLANIMKEMSNMSEDDLENMSNQFDQMMGQIDGSELGDGLDNEDDSNDKNGFGNVLGNIFSFNKDKGNNKNNNNSGNKVRKTKYLDTFGENLTQKARENKIDKVIGRETELQRMIQILNRRSKNNPVLIGEPGVGKTAVINALAIKIANGDVPGKLINKEVYMIDMTSLVAGTQFRGQFESRVKGIIDECRKLGNVILAIDEVHNIVGGLEHDNSMNAANMLKPALANGTVQLIGATTLKEYRQYIEKDSALERRFQPVMVDEPTEEECYEILKGVKSYYEDYHKVKIPDSALRYAVSLSSKYIHDRFLPDKAIDLLDEACARVNLEDMNLAKIEKLKNELNEEKQKQVELEEELEKKQNMSKVTNGSVKNAEEMQEDTTQIYEQMAKNKEVTSKLESTLDELIKNSKPHEVTYDNIAQVVELWTKIPVMRIKTTDTEKLLSLKDNLSKKIIGQDYAITRLTNAILRKRSNIITSKRPPSFIFVGPTGVGKTALVKALAYELFDNEDAVIKLDMSEYMESNSTSKLIGSPPGYVGYDEAGQLTEKVRRNPYSIVLFDEIEKAHPSVYNILLQILDDGVLTDSQGRSVSFKHTIIILTSNLGTNFKSDGFGFANSNIENDMLENKTAEALKEYFSPEFLNRIDDIITFNKLDDKSIYKIADLMLKELQEDTKSRNILFTYTPEVVKFIAKKGHSEKFGARPLRRAIQTYIEDILAVGFIKNEIKENKEYTLDVDKKNDKIIIKE